MDKADYFDWDLQLWLFFKSYDYRLSVGTELSTLNICRSIKEIVITWFPLSKRFLLPLFILKSDNYFRVQLSCCLFYNDTFPNRLNLWPLLNLWSSPKHCSSFTTFMLPLHPLDPGILRSGTLSHSFLYLLGYHSAFILSHCGDKC